MTFNETGSLPLWDGSGSLLIYSAQRKDNFGIHVKAADGSGERKTLVPDNNSLFQVPYAWSQREQSVLFEFSVQDPYRTGIGKVAIDGRAERPSFQTQVIRVSHPMKTGSRFWLQVRCSFDPTRRLRMAYGRYPCKAGNSLPGQRMERRSITLQLTI